MAGIPTAVFTSTLTAIVAAIGERLFAGTRPILTGSTRRQALVFVVYLGSAIVTGLAGLLDLGFAPVLPALAAGVAFTALRGSSR